MCETFIDKLLNLFEGRPMDRDMAGKIDELRKKELANLEMEIKLLVSSSFEKR